MENIPSPLTSEVCILEKEISKKIIIDLYKGQFNYDVSGYYKNIENISVYRCQDSNYRFYYPFDISADEVFYDYFQQFDWYYVQDRWETKQVLGFLKPGSKILDVGCGKGKSLEFFQSNKMICTGLEINERARLQAQSKKINVYGSTIEEHSEQYPAYYDAVYSFHVLEHLTDNILSFLDSCLKCIKPGGKLILSVPNNEGFAPQNSVLNYPPHHMGLWDNRSLSYLSKIFPIEEIKTLYSPLLDEQLPDFYHYAAKEIGEKPFLIRSFSRFPFTYRYFINKKKRAYTILKIFRKA